MFHELFGTDKSPMPLNLYRMSTHSDEVLIDDKLIYFQCFFLFSIYDLDVIVMTIG